MKNEAEKMLAYSEVLRKVLLKKAYSGVRVDPDKRILTGIPGLDTAAGGGYVPGAFNVISGGNGAGKTIFCLQSFLSRKFTAKERGLIISFFEDRAAIGEKARQLGYSLNRFVQVLYVPRPLFEPDRLFFEIHEEFSKGAVKHILIDSINECFIGGKTDLRFAEALIALAKHYRVSALASYLTPDLPEKAGKATDRIYALSDMAVHLDYVQQENEKTRNLKILKSPLQKHDDGIKHFNMMERGIRLTGYDFDCALHEGRGMSVRLSSYDDINLDNMMTESFKKTWPDIVLRLVPISHLDSLQTIKKKIKDRIFDRDLLSVPLETAVGLAKDGLILAVNMLYNFPSQPYDNGLLITCMKNDQIYGIPDNAIPHCLVYRKDLLLKYGMKPPASWSELIEQSAYAQKQKGAENGLTYSAKSGPMSEVLLTLLYSWKKNLKWDEDALFFKEGYLPVMKFLHDCVYKHKITPPYCSELIPENVATEFAAGRSLFALCRGLGPFFVNARISHRKYPSEKIGFMPFPAREAGCSKAVLLAASAVTIPASVKKPVLAGTLLSHVNSYEINLKVHTIGNFPTLSGRIDVNKELARTIPFFAEAEDLIRSGRVIKAHYAQSFTRAAGGSAAELFSEGRSPEAAAKKISTGIKAAEKIVFYDGPINDAIKYMEKKYSEKISISDIAASAKLSSNFFEKLFKSKTGLTAHDHLGKIRVNHAIRLLKERHDLNVSEVSVKSGYSDPNYFTKAFKKQTGLTPSEYRLRNTGR